MSSDKLGENVSRIKTEDRPVSPERLEANHDSNPGCGDAIGDLHWFNTEDRPVSPERLEANHDYLKGLRIGEASNPGGCTSAVSKTDAVSSTREALASKNRDSLIQSSKYYRPHKFSREKISLGDSSSCGCGGGSGGCDCGACGCVGRCVGCVAAMVVCDDVRKTC